MEASRNLIASSPYIVKACSVKILRELRVPSGRIKLKQSNWVTVQMLKTNKKM